MEDQKKQTPVVVYVSEGLEPYIKEYKNVHRQYYGKIISRADVIILMAGHGVYGLEQEIESMKASIINAI